MSVPRFAGGTTLFGVGASSGAASGPARLVRSEADARRIEHGEIAVLGPLPATWVPWLAHAAGVVAGGGGTLCNGATVLRELGIPTVTGLGPAVSAIQPDTRVVLDGTSGAVILMAEPDARTRACSPSSGMHADARPLVRRPDGTPTEQGHRVCPDRGSIPKSRGGDAGRRHRTAACGGGMRGNC